MFHLVCLSFLNVYKKGSNAGNRYGLLECN